MNVKSIESSPFYYPTSFSQSPPTPSILDHVKGLIEAYNTNFATEENVIISAKWLLEEINQLKDIGVKRECLCRLLTLEMEEVQHLIVEEVTSLFDLRTFLYDIQHGQAQQLIQLEEITSEIIASKLSLNELNFLFPICMIYQNILEHLWLLPHLESSNYCANLLAQNKTFILSHMEHWKDNFDQLAKEEKIEPLIPKNLEMAVLRLFEPLPEAIVKKIEEEKSVIHKSGEMTSRILEIIILVCSDQGDFPRAIFHAEVFLEFLRQKCSEMSQKGKLIIRIMQIHRNLATWNQILKQYERAIYYGKEALRIARESGNPYEVIINLKGMGSLYIAQGRGKLALPFYTEARSITQILKDAENESKILTDLADAYLSIDKNDEAITCFQAALNLAENKFEQALICIEIANAYAKGQCYQLAKEAYQKALHFCPQDNIFLAIIIHEKFANFFVNFSRYEKAISHAEKILELIQHSSVQKKESKTLDIKLRALTILGNIYGTFGDYARELDYHTQALEINEKPNFFSQSLEITYSNLGNAYGNVKDYSKSIDYYNKALGITKDVSLRTKIFLNMANVWGELGKFDKTIELYEEANKIDNLEIKQHSLLGLGVCYDIMGNKEQAIQCIEKSICLSQASKDRLNEALGYHNLGEVYSKSDLRLAEENYRKSIAISAALHQELKNHQQWQITFFEEQAKTLLSLERLLIKQSKIEEVLRVTDFRRSRALVSALTEKFQFQKVDSLTSSGLTSQDMQALAHKLNTCFILYSFSVENTDSITVWVVPAQGEIICQQLPLGILKEEVEEAPYIFKTSPPIVEPTIVKRRPFRPTKKTRSLTTHSLLEKLARGKSDDQSNPADLQTFKERLALCYETLIAPLEVYLPKDLQQVVTIIPDGFLAQIPFAAFLDRKGKYFIEKHPISIVPSMGILKLLDEIPKDFPKSSLVIGNPTTPHLKDTLPLAEKEAQAIVAPLLKTTLERTLLQDNATAERVLEGMQDARWIHLACHGSTGAKPEEKLDPHSVFEGLFKLAPDESHSRGYLHAQEIASLTLRTELVFMSTCSSGRGKLYREGSIGPVWSFLAAGALSTVATYCELRDSDLTLQMVDTFYRHLLGIEMEKLNKAQALRKAMLVGIEQKRDKPHLWGAFFLSGLHE